VQHSQRFEFITLKNTERLVNYSKLVDPYQVYDEIDISDNFDDTSVITKLNRKLFIDNSNVCVTNGLDENKLQKLSNKSIYIYTLSTFKIIQSMLNEIIGQVDIKKVVSCEKNEVEIIKNSFWIENGTFYNCNSITWIDKCGYKSGHKIPHILSFKLLSNQDLVLIHMEGIIIFTINENGLRLRYFWNNNEWHDIYKKFREEHGEIWDNKFTKEHYKKRDEIVDNFINEHYKPLIERILKNEFDDSKHSIPLPIIVDVVDLGFLCFRDRKEIVEDIINGKIVPPKFVPEMLKIAIKGQCNDVVRQIIESTQGYSENDMTIISLNLAELCDYYPDYIITYISRTSIMLSPYCLKIGNSKNSLLHSYTDIYIKRSNMENNYFKPISATYQTVSFVVPFPQICVY
jgi:hypothetical protein